MAQNEWNCDCKLRWLIEFFQDYRQEYLSEHNEAKNLEESGATCSKYSSSLLGNKNRDSGIILTELNPVLMKCKGERILSVCEDICPDQCICDQKTKTVNCANVGLNIVPDKLPVYTEVLDLSGNQIKEIPGFLAKFPIVELDLSQNQIQIRADMFATLQKLKILKLDTNEIQSIPRYTFSGLPKLEKLSLRNNNIRCLSNDTFYPFELKGMTHTRTMTHTHPFRTD